MRRLVLFNLGLNRLLVLGTGVGKVESLLLRLEQLLELASYPAVLALLHVRQDKYPIIDVDYEQ